MRISCRRARALLVENIRGSVPESALLQLDLHLTDCAACREERARISTLTALRDWTPVGLGSVARARIVANLAARRAPTRQVARPRRAAPWIAALVAGTAMAAIVVGVVSRHHKAATTVVAYEWKTAGSTRLLDAELRYEPGTHVEVNASARTLVVARGNVDVLDDGAPIRVKTPHASVLVTGRARFAGEQIRVWSGTVVVFDSGMKEVATVHAGETWPPPPPPSPLPVPAPASTNPPPSPKPEPQAASPDDVAVALDRARTALAAGDTKAARRAAHRAYAAAVAPRQRAEAELFMADSFLVDHDAERAIAVYRQVAIAFPRTAEGDTAAFAAAQVLYERGRLDEARAALRSYVARYPDGRFTREATDRLSALGE
jgi:hypothetical protein